jgi:hypothetical protein
VRRFRRHAGWGLYLLGLLCGLGLYAVPLPAQAGGNAPPTAPKLDLEGRVEDRVPVRSWQQNEDEAKAYCESLIAAHTTPQEAFVRSARRDITYAHLFEEPAKYRGEVVHFRGRLKRVRRFDAPSFVRKSYDLPYAYEGWLFDPEVSGANPVCVVFTELPAGVRVAEECDQRVTFDGYFFKRYRYYAGDGWREAPLLIGHTVVPRPAPPPPSGESDLLLSHSLNAFLLCLAGTGVLAAGLVWWYKRGDTRVRSLLARTSPPADFMEFSPGDADQPAGSQQETEHRSWPT